MLLRRSVYLILEGRKEYAYSLLNHVRMSVCVRACVCEHVCAREHICA